MSEILLPREQFLKKFYEGGDADNPIIGMIVDWSDYKNKASGYSGPLGQFTYKVRLCTGNTQQQSDDQVISVPAPVVSSGRLGIQGGSFPYSKGDFVRLAKNKRTKQWRILGVAPVCAGVELSQNQREGICEARSGWSFKDNKFQIPLNSQGPGGGNPINEFAFISVPDPAKWETLYQSTGTIQLKSGCEPSSMSGVPSAIRGIMKDIQDLRTNLLGDDSFLVTSQEFVNQAQSKVDALSSMMTGVMTWVIQEIKKQILRLVNQAVNATVGNLYLNTRYQLFEGVDSANNAICCAFAALLDLLADFIADAINNFINDIINPVACAIENFLSDLLGQIANGILNAISGILAGIGNLIGTAIDAIDAVLGVVESLLNLFEGCPPRQICPADEEWNFLDGVGGSGATTLDIQGIFDRVNSSISAFTNVGDAVTDFAASFDNFDFGLDPNSALASANSCFVGPVPCGSPTVRFFGGGATSSASGIPVVSSSGSVIGITLTSSGFGYSSPPMVVIDDPCGLGVGARGVAVLGPVSVSPPPGSRGGGRPPRIQGLRRSQSPTPTTTPIVSAGTPLIGGAIGPLRVGGGGGVPVVSGATGGGVVVTAGGLPVSVGALGGTPITSGGTILTVGGSPVTVGGIGGTPLRANGNGGTPVTINGTPVTSGGSGGTSVVVSNITSSTLSSTPSTAVGLGASITCDYPPDIGYNGPGIYLDLTSISSSSVSVNFTVSQSGSFTYNVDIPNVSSFIQATSTPITFNLEGGKIYGPCTVNNGTLYVGNTVVDGVAGSGSLSETQMIVEDGGDDWDDFVITTSRGIFVDLDDCTPTTSSVGITTVLITSTGYGYLPAPDGSRGANGRVYGDRCQTLIQRSDGTWDQPYTTGETITIETGDRVALPGMGEIELGDTNVPKDLAAIGAYIVKVNPPIVTNTRYRSMVGFNDSRGTVSTNIRPLTNFFTDWYGDGSGFGRADLLAARRQGFSDAEIRNFLEKDFKGVIGGAVRAILANPDWGRIPSSTANTSGESWFSLEDYNEAKRQGYEDADIRFYLEKNYTGRISPRVQNLLNDPTFGRVVRSDLKSMIGFDDFAGSSGSFGYARDYPAAKAQGYSDADIRYYLENVYTGQLGPVMREKLNDPSWGRTQPVGYTGIRQMFGFDDSTGSVENGRNHFGYLTDYQEARRQGYSDADIRYYLENHYTGKIGPRMIEALNDPNFGRIQGISNMAGAAYGQLKDMSSFGDGYGSGPGVFGNADYEEARRQGYTDADVRNYLENVYSGVVGVRMKNRLADPAWGRRISDSGFSDVPGEPGAFGELDYEQATRQELSDNRFLANAGTFGDQGDNTARIYENFRQQGYTDADVRYYLENYYTGRIGPRMQARLDDPNWGRELPVVQGETVSAPTRIKSMIGFMDRPGRKDEFSTADLEDARKRGFRDVDVRFFLENNYNGFISESIRRLLSDPNWGRLGQTITVAFTAPGCPDDTVAQDFISSTTQVVSTITDVAILDPGFRYNCAEDQIVVTPSNGAVLEYECVNGSISAVKVVNGGSGFTELPEITINTSTGFNARLLPVLGFNVVTQDGIGAADAALGGEGVTPIKIVDCVGRIPPRRQLDIVPE